jgi:acetyltransferase
MDVTLESGRRIVIRPIAATDGPALEAAYLALSPRSKYQRFLASKPELTSEEVRYLTELDGRNHIALVATPADNRNRILGVGRFVRLRDDPRAAEFAVTIGDPYQGEGIATKLLEQLAAIAADRGIERVTATMLAENVAAHKLMRRLASKGFELHERHAGITDELEVKVAA